MGSVCFVRVKNSNSGNELFSPQFVKSIRNEFRYICRTFMNIKDCSSENRASGRVSVTIIMPIRNEEGFIERSLGSVLIQEYPRDCMEILVVDGMSEDRTKEIVKRTISQLTINNEQLVIKLLDNPYHVVAMALNIGLKHARGDIIVRVDGHCEIAPDYVRRCVEALHATGADCVGGLQRPMAKKLIGKAISLAITSPFGVGNAVFHYREKPAWVDTVYLGAYRRDVFERVGGFDEEMKANEDNEFNLRLLQAGGKIWLDPAISSIYHNRITLRGFWCQYFRYGFGKMRVMQKRKVVASYRHMVPSLFIFGIAASLLFAFFTYNYIFVLVLVGPYILINLLVSLWKTRKDWKVFVFLPIAFLTIHISYGIGFIWGLWYWKRYGFRFWIRRNSKSR